MKIYTCIPLFLLCSLPLSAKPLLVYILCGQSNMQGHADIRTFEHIGMDPKTAPLLKEMQNADGTPKVIKDVWISSIDSRSETGEKHGQLTAGYGASETKIGPEFTFGIYMQKIVKQPILIIKTSWGGKSINTDFRPPSAGVYQFNDNQIEAFKKQGKDVAAMKKERAERSGHYYRLMMGHIQKVLGDIKQVYPDYNEKEGYRVAGFVWFQGWNDMVDGGTYQMRGQPGSYDAYSEVLAHFIRDVRKDLDVKKLPFVIGVMGAGGPIEKYTEGQKRYAGVHGEFRKAMAAPASMKEFKGNVHAVLTEKYWDDQLNILTQRQGKLRNKSRELGKQKLSNAEKKKALDAYKAELFTKEELKILEVGVSNAAYHYLGSSKVFAQIGKAFAEALDCGCY